METIRAGLKEKIIGKKIAGVEVRNKKVVQGCHKNDLAKRLTGESIDDIGRIGKLMTFKLDGGGYFLIHLKMTGQLIYTAGERLLAGGHSDNKGTIIEDIGGEPPNKYTRVIFIFEDESKLYFNDMRLFGYIRIVDDQELEKIKKDMGPDALSPEFTAEYLRQALSGRKSEIKKSLLDQKIVAGIGNIYADEILFASGIRPDRPANKISKKGSEAIVEATRDILRKAIDCKGTTFRNYTDANGDKGNFSSMLKVYGRKEGEKCYECGGAIRAIRINNRGTKYCPKCQR